MLKQVIARGVTQSAPTLLRRSTFARNLSQSAAALQEPAAAAVDKNAAIREERILRMEAYVRKYWAEKGCLPKAYILTKQFGGARTIAPKVLERLEPELNKNGVPDAAASSKPATALKSSPASTQKASSDGPANMSVATSTSHIAASTPSPGSSTPLSSKTTSSETGVKDQGKKEVQAAAEVKEPAFSLWEKLHSIASAKATPTRSSQAPSARPAITPPPPPRQSAACDSTEEDDSESESSDSEVDLPAGSEDKNPAQPLLRSDLQPRHGLYIKFLAPQATESDVKAAFRSCGDIHRIQIVRSRNPGAKYIYGFVDFTTEEALNSALKKEIIIRGIKVQTEPSKNGAPKEKQQKQESDSDDDAAKSNKNKTSLAVTKTMDDLALAPEKRRCTLALESIPHASLPQIIDALGQYGEVVNSQTKHSSGGNTTAYVEFKSEIEKDTALAASKVILGGKSLKLTRVDIPLTTVVRLSNIPADAREKIASSYKSYGQVDKVDPRMDGVVDIYYSASEIKNMAKILDKLNGLHVSRRKLRAMPAPISYPKTMAELAGTPQGLKWLESQRELVRKNLEISLAKAAMYSRDFEQLLTTTSVPAK
ncbi:hypothetical protein SELMODRAFT_447288 [Selaginella moellendorffii]|uniref:RRM domain-containing protein n=2 Tax=Selaginella moellendorffii TaxID=88036 RepID=D8SY92_SELML|nr:hypothetical protein SELMODRAFT_447288 [Selaginella moellendorffii]